jgi:hypothetical protein
MTNFDYNRDIPNGPNNPSNDQPLMKINTNSTDDLIAVDHISFGTNNGGYHTVVHLSPFSTTATNPPDNEPVSAPTPVLGIGELFCAEINDGFDVDTALFFQSGKGKVSQLTSNLVPSIVSNGYTFLPGGLILQWATATATSPANTVTFPVAFKVACFSVTISQNSGIGPVTISSISNINFKADSGVPGSITIRYMAIGV